MKQASGLEVVSVDDDWTLSEDDLLCLSSYILETEYNRRRRWALSEIIGEGDNDCGWTYEGVTYGRFG